MKRNPKVLNEAQIESWNKNGYIFIKDFIPSLLVEKLKTAVLTLEEKERKEKKDADFDIGLDKKFIVSEMQIFRDMIDHEISFPYILDLIGPYAQLCLSHALVRPAGSDFSGFIHTDGGQGMHSIQLSEASRPLQIKIQYFLTDVTEKNSGNFIFVPGSHKRHFPIYEAGRNKLQNTAEQLLVNAGDIAIFPNTLWHGAAMNTSGNDRVSIIYGYNQMFMRPYDYIRATDELLGQCTSRQRRLLGDTGVKKPQAHYYAPKDQINVIEGMY